MANQPSEPALELAYDAARAISDALDADVILFNQQTSEQTASEFHGVLESLKPRRTNAFVMLVTFGGDAHAAYVIARDLQLHYEKVILCIAGDCYSAGTLIVLCANELVLTDRGRLGPLDVQLLKKDELSERLSGLTVSIALDELHVKAFEALTSIAEQLKRRFGPQLTFRTAMDVAATVTAQMFGEVYKQIDPIRLGEDARALQIAGHYGQRLGEQSGNLKSGAVERLLEAYPSHECIIDRTEAEELFLHVRAPEGREERLLRQLGALASDARVGHNSPILVVFEERAAESTKKGRTDASIQEKEPDDGSLDGESGGSQVRPRGDGSSGKAKSTEGLGRTADA